MSEANQAALDEGVLPSEAQYILIQLRLDSKLPSSHSLLPHRRRLALLKNATGDLRVKIVMTV
jgi:hypothetical protein